MDLDGQLMQEQFHSSQVGCVSNDFDVNEFELEEEQEGEDRIDDVVSSDSDDSDGDQGDKHACNSLGVTLYSLLLKHCMSIILMCKCV